MVRTGCIEIFKKRGDAEIVISTLEVGGVFGEMALIDNEVRSASARAVNGPATIMVIPRDLFEEKIANSDPLVRAMLLSVTQYLRLEHFRTKLTQFDGASGSFG